MPASCCSLMGLLNTESPCSLRLYIFMVWFGAVETET